MNNDHCSTKWWQIQFLSPQDDRHLTYLMSYLHGAGGHCRMRLDPVWPSTWDPRPGYRSIQWLPATTTLTISNFVNDNHLNKCIVEHQLIHEHHIKSRRLYRDGQGKLRVQLPETPEREGGSEKSGFAMFLKLKGQHYKFIHTGIKTEQNALFIPLKRPKQNYKSV